jgi:hypothetical protein
MTAGSFLLSRWAKHRPKMADFPKVLAAKHVFPSVFAARLCLVFQSETHFAGKTTRREASLGTLFFADT